MILLVDLSWKAGTLSRNEFVDPVARIVSRAGLAWREAHFSGISEEQIRGADGIILCGTALQDNLFAGKVQEFSWLKDTRVPVLGICAGMQALCLVFGGTLRPASEIGMTTIRITRPNPLFPDRPPFEAYELHSFACDPPAGWEVTAVSDRCVQAVCHPDRPLYGVMFHPEVRNDLVVKRFCSLCRE
ncbi:MAG: gamma-glutamyl-gamma-aminobutyrate hydrolase family protein [Methanoregula sp.]|uniref:glutamine amidotransferase-related protein n=1 Tax=Methanoregula sp. TaxID=2052170 RepID=UPI003C780089